MRERKVVNILLTIVMFLMIFGNGGPSIAEAATSGAYEYMLINSDTEVEITEYIGSGGDVVVPSEIAGKPVTVIGERAFRQKGLTSVVIPDSVEYIEAYGFSENVVLNSVVLGNGVKTISHHAFYYNRITDLTIGSGVKTIEDYAFYSNELLSVTVPGSVTNIGYAAFGYSPLVRATIPASVTSINDDVFLNNRAHETLTVFGEPGSAAEALADAKSYIFVPLGTPVSDYEYQFIDGDTAVAITSYIGIEKDIVIPSEIEGTPVTKIYSYAFRSKNLTSVTIPDSVTVIGTISFYYNDLTSLVVPGSISDISDNAFASNALSSLTIGEGVSRIGVRAFGSNDLTSVIIPDSVTVIDAEAFADNQLTDVSIPPTVISIDSDAFDRNQDNPAVLTIYGESGSAAETLAADNGYTFVPFYKYRLINNGTEAEILEYQGILRDIVIPAEFEGKPVTKISSDAFKSKQLTGVSIPDSVTSVGYAAFYGNHLVSVDIPDRVTLIGYGAFAYNQLTNVTLGTAVTSIGPYAFDSNQLSSVSIPGTITSINSNAFDGNQANPADLTIYGDFGTRAETLADEKGYTFVSFYGYTLINADTEVMITGYTGPGGDIVIPAEIEGKPVTRLADNAFKSKQLTGVVIPDGITNLGYAVFYGNDITSIEIPDAVNTIGYGTFAYNQLTSVVIPDSVQSIGSYAFDTNQLSSVTIPANTTLIASNAFGGNQAEPEDLTIYGEKGSVAETFAKSQGYTFVASDVFVSSDFECVLINDDKEIKIVGYRGIGGDITIPSEINGKPVTYLSTDAFSSKQLTSVSIPSSVTTIHRGAFYNNQLTNLALPNSVSSIGYGAFASNQLTSLIIPDSVRSIGSYAFDSNQLNEVVIPKMVLSIASNAFNGNQTDPADLTIYGHGGTVAESVATTNGYTFIASIFNDMDVTDWYYDTIRKLVSIGAISGYPDGSFKPNAIIKKGEFITLILVGKGYKQDPTTGEHWAMPYIRKAEELGVTDTDEYVESELNEGITRNEMAKIAVRAIRLTEELDDTDLARYSAKILDFEEIPRDYEEYVLLAFVNGILTGYPDGTFRGERTLTRAEASVVALRVFKPSERV